MRKRQGLRKPAGIRKAEWNSLSEYTKNKIIRKQEEREAKANLMPSLPDFVKGIGAAEAGLPMDIASIIAPGGGQSHAQRLTQMRPGGHSGYEEQEFVPEYKGTSLDLYEKMGGTPGSGSGLAGELLAPGALITTPFIIGSKVKKALSNIPKVLNKGGEVLSRVFKGGEPIFANKGMEDTAELLAKLKAEGKEGDIFIARDILKSMANKNEIYNKQIREYAGFDNWLDNYENKHAEGKKKHTTVSLNDLEEFWAENNLDIREVPVERFTKSYIPEGGENAKMAVLTYHGKQRPMTLQTLTNLNELANRTHHKSFDELDRSEQAFLENFYPAYYPEDKSAQFNEVLDPGSFDKNILSKITPEPVIAKRNQINFRSGKSDAHHGEPNAIGHMRYDERPGIGDQAGERHLNFFETQSDWALQATREGVIDIGEFDEEIYKLLLKNRNKTDKLQTMDSSSGRTPEAKKLAEEIDDIHADINILRKRKKELIDKMFSENAVPRIPFIFPKDQEKWMRLMLKRQIKLGIDGGFDRITLGSKELAQEYGTVTLKNVHKIKIRKIPPEQKISTQKKQFNKDGEPIGALTLTGDKYPYHVVGFDQAGNQINKEIDYYSKEGLNSTFGKELAEKIINKAKSNGKTVISDIDDIQFGAENLNVLYNRTIPNLLNKDPDFKKLDLELETIPLGTNKDITAITKNINEGGTPTPPDLVSRINPANRTAEQRAVTDTASRNFVGNGNMNILEGEELFGVDWESTDWNSALHDRVFMFDAPDNEIFVGTGESISIPFKQGYRTSGDFKIDLDFAIEEGELSHHTLKVLKEMHEAMKYVEIHGNIPSYTQVVDQQWVRLMDPETRQIELTHIKEELRQNYEIDIWDDGTNKPMFKFTDAANTDEPFTADQYRDMWIDNLQRDAGGENIVNDGRLVEMFMEEPDLFRQVNLMKRYEIAGDPLMINDPEMAREVLTRENVAYMPTHLQQYTVEYDGIVHSDNLQGVDPNIDYFNPNAEGDSTNIIHDRFNNSETVNNAVMELEDLGGGIRVTQHNDPPYLTFTSDALIEHVEDGNEVETSFRGAENFLQALDDGVLGPSGDRDMDEIRNYVRQINDIVRPTNTRQTLIEVDKIEWDKLRNNEEGLNMIGNFSLEVRDTVKNMHDIQDRIEGIFSINTHWMDPDVPPLFSIGDNTEMLSKEELLSHHMIWDMDEIEELKEYLMDFKHYHKQLSKQVDESDNFVKNLKHQQPKVLSVKLKGNKKLDKFKDKNFYYGAIPPGLLAGEALRQQNQQQSLLE